MKIFPAKILVAALLASLLLFLPILLQAGAASEQPAAGQQQKPGGPPDLSEIIPLANDLSGRLALLQSSVPDSADLSGVAGKYEELGALVEKVSLQIAEIKGSGDYSWVRLENLIQRLREEKKLSEETNIPLAESIRRLADWKDEWQAERARWRKWEDQLSSEGEPDQLKPVFTQAHQTIDRALDLILRQLDTFLLTQAKGGAVLARIDILDAQAQELIDTGRKEYLLAEWHPMLSAAFLVQLGTGVGKQVLENFGLVTWPEGRYFVRQRWFFISQASLVLAVVFILYRNRRALSGSEHWRFLAARPIAAGLFVGILSQILFPKYLEIPVSLKLLYAFVGWFSFTRLLGLVIVQPWKRQAAFGVTVFFLITIALEAISFPLPLYRLYILLVSLLALFYSVRWTRESIHDKDLFFYPLALRLGTVILGIMIIGQLLGRKGMVVYIFKSSLVSLAIVFAFALFILIIRGGLHWIFFSSPIWRIKQLRSQTEKLVRWVGFLAECAIWGFAILPTIITVWGVYGNVSDATSDLLGLGFDLGSLHISLGLVLTAATILYGSLLLSWVLPRVLLDELVLGSGMERGVRISIGRLIQYFIIFVGFVVMLTTLGFDLTKLTIMLSALGVGIGFGLQGVVNNFVSGIILLFEQPVRVGDSIEIGGNWAEIKRMGLRSTTVQTLDKADVIIPNTDLINNQVINWTLSNRQVRLIVPVGVAYGSDVPLVFATLQSCAENHKMIAITPPPQVLFVRFAESSLDFELRVWLTDVDNRVVVKSDLHQEIDRRFREAGIEIAFPQRDLHLRSIDSSISLPSQKATG